MASPSYGLESRWQGQRHGRTMRRQCAGCKNGSVVCKACDGNGRLRKQATDASGAGSGTVVRFEICKKCDGTTWVGCATCDGTGAVVSFVKGTVVQTWEERHVDVPPLRGFAHFQRLGALKELDLSTMPADVRSELVTLHAAALEKLRGRKVRTYAEVLLHEEFVADFDDERKIRRARIVGPDRTVVLPAADARSIRFRGLLESVFGANARTQTRSAALLAAAALVAVTAAVAFLFRHV